MCRIWVPSIAFVVAIAGVAVAAGLQSGLQIGEQPNTFHVKDITGPDKGKPLCCYVCAFGEVPVVSIFAREITDNFITLVKQVDDHVGRNRNKQMSAFVVLLAENVDVAAGKLEELAKTHGIKNVPLTVFDGTAGPLDYKINKDAEVTVHLWRKYTVKANHAFAKGKLDQKGIDTIIADTSKILQ